MGNRNRNRSGNQHERGYDSSSQSNRGERGYGEGYGSASSFGNRSERGFGDSSGYGYRGDQEPYFGSGRMQYGEGYSQGSSGGYGESGGRFGESGRFGSSYPSDQSYRGGSGGQESDYGYRGSQNSFRGHGAEEGYSSGSDRNRSDYSGSRGPWSYGSGVDSNYPNRSRYSGETGGMYSGENEGGSGYGNSSYGRSNTGTSGSGQYGNYPDSETRYNSRGYNQEERGWLDRAADEVSSWFGGGDESSGRREEGKHRGRGPKGYSRSDDRIREDINDRLTDFAYIDASNIEVQVEGGEVTLTGTVESRYEKRLAEDLTEAISGVSHVENRLRVSQSSSQYGTGTSNTGMSNTGTSTSGMSGSTETTSMSDTDTSATSSKSKTATSR